MQEPSEWLAAAARIIGTLTDRWAEAGALAAIRYRLSERVTTDADILLEWHDGLVAAFERAGYHVDVNQEPDGDHPFLLFVRRDRQLVDLIIAEVPFQHEALDRMKDHVLTVEDVIVFKLLAWRARDRDDVASILAAGHDLDVGYIDRWAREWDVVGRWAQARAGR